MFDLDEFTKTIFEDIRDGVPIVDSRYSFQMGHLDSIPAANGPVDHQHFQGSFLRTPTPGTSSSDMMFVPDGNEHLLWGITVPSNLVQNDLRHTAHPRAAISSNCMVPNNVSVPPPPTARRKRRMDDDVPHWYASKCAREVGMDTVERIPLACPRAAAMGFPGTHDYTEGNALRQNNISTRTSDYEEISPVAGSVPVAERLSAQGPRPMMTSSAASQMAAEYSSQLLSVPFSALPSSAAPATSSHFDSIPDASTEYSFGSFAQPSFIGELVAPRPSQELFWAATQQVSQRRVQARLDTSFQAAWPSSFSSPLMPWPIGAAGENTFPSGPTPSLSTGYGVDPPFTSVAEQPSDKDLVVPVQAPQTSATLPQPLPDPVAESSFGVASQGSSSSSSAPKPSNAAPQKKGKKKAQTPFLLAEDKCHLCNEGFKRGSELHHHWTTNKHRLREREAENPGVIVTVDDLTPNCLCPSCGKGYTTPYVVKRHLKKCAGQAGSSQSGSQDGEGGR